MNKKLTVLLLTISAIVVGFAFKSCKSPKSMIDKTVVNELNLNKYLGTWYEIARYDHRFERGLVGVKANYSMREDGKIKVVNSGYKGTLSGKYSEAIGKAKIPDPENQPAKLKVSFFWFFYGDYYVLELDKNYQWALIGSSSDKYLWILSRTPHVDDDLYNALLTKLEKRGYGLSKLIKVEQK
jgi:lipocalin